MMAQTLEDIKGGEGMIKLGTTGTIGSLMMRELDQISDVPNNQEVPSLSKTQTLHASVTSQKQRKSLDDASSSSGSSSNIINHRSSGIAPKTKLASERHHHRIPMLGSESFQVERSPIRKRNDKKKKSNIVEVVDIKCGHPDNKAWSTPITNSLKKLGFSKLSESII